MDPKELRQRLEQVAVLKDRKPSRSPNHRPAIEYITEIDEFGEEYEVPVEIKENATLGYDLVKVNDRIQACELGCGDIVTNQIVEKRHCSTPKSHWRTRCSNCDHYVSPDGVGFIRGSHQIQKAYNKHFNQQLKQEKLTQHVEVPDGVARITEFPDYTEITTNDNIIRKYK